MNFEQRKQKAMEMLCTFFASYVEPRGMTEDALSQRVTNIADAFARRMPTEGDFAEKVEAVFDKIRDSHMSNTWPSQAVFVSAMPEENRKMKVAAETFTPDDPLVAAAARINEGAKVPDRHIWGSVSIRLLNGGYVTKDRMDAYRDGSIRHHKSVYGADTAKFLQQKFGDVVLPYVG